MKDVSDKESTGKLIAKALEIIDGPVCMHVEFDRTCSGCIDFMKTNYTSVRDTGFSF